MPKVLNEAYGLAIWTIKFACLHYITLRVIELINVATNTYNDISTWMHGQHLVMVLNPREGRFYASFEVT